MELLQAVRGTRQLIEVNKVNFLRREEPALRPERTQPPFQKLP